MNQMYTETEEYDRDDNSFDALPMYWQSRIRRLQNVAYKARMDRNRIKIELERARDRYER